MNYSLRRFGAIVLTLIFAGILCLGIGVIVLSMNLGYSYSESGVGIGMFFLYIGGTVFGLGVFGAFLRITAASIIEGLGGNMAVANQFLTPPSHVFRNTLDNLQSEPPGAQRAHEPSDESQYFEDPVAWAQRNLSSSNYEWWTEMGRPNLMRWVNEGRPDFKEWIKANKN